MVECEVDLPGTVPSFVQAIEDPIHRGLFDPLLQMALNTPINSFEDDTLMADTCYHILTAMTAGIESLFIIFGELSETNHRSPLAWINSQNLSALRKIPIRTCH